SLPGKNTDALIGGVTDALAAEGIRLADPSALLKPLLAVEGIMSRRKPSKEELASIDYGRRVAHALAGFDIGQSVAIAERACVAVEAMEGTDAKEVIQHHPPTWKVGVRVRITCGNVPGAPPYSGKSWLSVNLTVAARLMHV